MNTRILSVCGFMPYQDARGYYRKIPRIHLQGVWLEGFGFAIDRKVSVECKSGELVIRLIEENEKGRPP